MATTATGELESGPASAAAVRTRVANVDVLRAAAALAVLAIHAYALGGRVAPVRAQHWYDVPLINLATGVWLFFAISGYVITRPFVDRLLTDQPLPAAVPYALRRALRIFPLYWISLTVLIAIDGSTGTRAWQFPFHYLLLNNLIPGRQQALFPAAWTLTLEVLFYIAVPLVAAAVRRARPALTAEQLAAIVLASWLLSIAFTVTADLQGDGQTGLWLRGSFPAMWQMFCPGIMLAIAPHLKHSPWRRWVVDFPRRRVAIAAGAAALLIGAALFADAPLRFGVVVYQLLFDASRPLFAVGYGLVVAAAIRSRPWGDAAPWLLRLGVASYGIYLIHPVIAALLLRVGLAPVPHNTLAGFVANLVCLLVLTVLVALAGWRWLEQPSIELGRRLGTEWSARRVKTVALPPEARL
jgi:peptidoglycan/LPS O-acetylase OafA/YrhL